MTSSFNFWNAIGYRNEKELFNRCQILWGTSHICLGAYKWAAMWLWLFFFHSSGTFYMLVLYCVQFLTICDTSCLLELSLSLGLIVTEDLSSLLYQIVYPSCITSMYRIGLLRWLHISRVWTKNIWLLLVLKGFMCKFYWLSI